MQIIHKHSVYNIGAMLRCTVSIIESILYLLTTQANYNKLNDISCKYLFFYNVFLHWDKSLHFF